MMRSPALLLALGLAATAASGAHAPLSAQAQEKPAVPEGEGRVEPKEIWPASLERIAGRYVFAQVASPGGLWLSSGTERTQVSLNELPPALRERLSKAEILISDLKLPSRVDASQRQSPAKRGYLRYYEEAAPGRLVLRNIPGIGGNSTDPGSYSGPVLFQISHASHSNPSISGVLQQRINQERTWGAATLDYADLNAIPLREPGGEDEVLPVIGNARILRSGVEIFAFVDWTEKEAGGGAKFYTGAIRLIKKNDPAAATGG